MVALDKLGYPYNIEDNKKQFSINLCPGAYITGNFYDSCFQLEIRYGGVASRLEDMDIYHPAGLSGYSTIFASLSENLKLLIEKYDEISKMDKRARLLRSLMPPALRKHKLFKTELYVDHDTLTFRLSKRIIGSVSDSKRIIGEINMITEVNFDNYEQRICKMAEAFRNPNISDVDYMILKGEFLLKIGELLDIDSSLEFEIRK